MNPYKAYQQQRDAGQTRIDDVLALYEQAIRRLDQALACLRSKEREAARQALAPEPRCLRAWRVSARL